MGALLLLGQEWTPEDNDYLLLLADVALIAAVFTGPLLVVMDKCR